MLNPLVEFTKKMPLHCFATHRADGGRRSDRRKGSGQAVTVGGGPSDGHAQSVEPSGRGFEQDDRKRRSGSSYPDRILQKQRGVRSFLFQFGESPLEKLLQSARSMC